MSRLYPRLAFAALLASALAAASLVHAANRVVTIHNKTDVLMTEFYASNVDTDDWEEDILGEDVLRPGQSFDVDIDDGTGACRFDFKGVFDDGDEVVKKNVNVCKVGSFSFTSGK